MRLRTAGGSVAGGSDGGGLARPVSPRFRLDEWQAIPAIATSTGAWTVFLPAQGRLPRRAARCLPRHRLHPPRHRMSTAVQRPHEASHVPLPDSQPRKIPGRIYPVVRLQSLKPARSFVLRRANRQAASSNSKPKFQHAKIDRLIRPAILLRRAKGPHELFATLEKTNIIYYRHGQSRLLHETSFVSGGCRAAVAGFADSNNIFFVIRIRQTDPIPRCHRCSCVACRTGVSARDPKGRGVTGSGDAFDAAGNCRFPWISAALSPIWCFRIAPGVNASTRPVQHHMIPPRASLRAAHRA